MYPKRTFDIGRLLGHPIVYFSLAKLHIQRFFFIKKVWHPSPYYKHYLFCFNSLDRYYDRCLHRAG